MFIKNDYRLRAIEKTDLNFLINLRNDPETSNNLGTFVFLNQTNQENWFNSLPAKRDAMFLMFDNKETVEKLDEPVQKTPETEKPAEKWTTLGLVRIADMDFTNRSMSVGGDIDQKYRGKGHAKHMYDLILDYGFNNQNMNRLWLSVLDYNDRARSVYEKAGFVKEGSQREAIYRNGQYHNYDMMSILKTEYVSNMQKLTTSATAQAPTAPAPQ